MKRLELGRMQVIESHELWRCLEWSGTGLFAYEESATFWLWAYPSLLGWPLKLEWLFSPVVGNTKYPGDLWGIDEAGQLLLVESKRGRGSDPFEDFIKFQKDRSGNTHIRADKLMARWQKLYQWELKFWNTYKMDLSDWKFKPVFYRGILPYSSKRFATWNWPALYRSVIVPHLFESGSYVENVKTFLERRIRSNLETIAYFGLVFVEEPCSALLSQKGQTHYEELQALTGQEKVRLICMTAQKLQSECSVRIITHID